MKGGKLEYTVEVASDMSRDGLAFELWTGGKQLGEVFRWDSERKLTVTLWEPDLPLNLVEDFVADAKERLLPFIDD